ncbi:MAG: type II secretion system F family protein [Eubacteriales bacterium]|nr:type II secretion system F family protein [Eubacteriales bacterium]MDD4476315.1 type II secretion system F family protein [Eubacteriales bacterium]
MELLVLSSSAFAFVFISILLSPLGKKIDIKTKRIDFVVNKKKDIINELDLSFYKRLIAPQMLKITEAMSKRKKTKNKKTPNNLLEKELRYAGIRIPADEYTVMKNIIVAPILIISIIIAFAAKIDELLKMLILLIGLITWVLVPRYYLKAKVTSRQNSIKYQLPDVMDLLCVSIEAGLGFDAALLKIAEKMEGPLIDEFMILYREIQMGRPRREALKDFGECSTVPELKAFASALIQADKLGIPLKNILKIQSEQLRTTRRQAAQEKGMKSPIKMMLPMIVFIFPVIFIILLGPVIVQLINQFSG